MKKSMFAPKKRRGKPVKYVPDADGKPIVGLSFDTGNGQFYYSHWRKECDRRPNFGSNYEEAIQRFKAFCLKKDKSLVSIELQSDPRPEITFKGKPLTEEVYNQNASVKEVSRTDDELVLEYDFKDDFRVKIASLADVCEADILEAAKMIVTKDPSKAKIIGLYEVNKNLIKCSIPLSEIFENFKNQPLFQVSDMPISRKNELKEIEKTWEYFCSAINKDVVGKIEKADIHGYHNHCLTIFHKDKYSTTWVRKKFDYVKRILNYVVKAYDDKNLEQLRIWCTDLLVPPAQIIQKPAKLISPETFKFLLSVTDPFEKAVLLLSMNAGYYATDLANVPMNAIDWDQKTIVYGRNKTGHVSRAAMLWNETIEALKAVTKHKGSTIFLNESTKAPYNKYYYSKLFAKVLKKATDKIEEDKLEITIDDKLVHSNCRDSVQTICSIKGNGISQSCDAVLGHRQAGVTGMYTDPKTYPQISADACNAVHDYYFGEEVKKNVRKVKK